MALTTNFVPLKFYQVKKHDVESSVATIAERFKVAPDKVERENASDSPLIAGEMLIINLG